MVLAVRIAHGEDCFFWDPISRGCGKLEVRMCLVLVSRTFSQSLKSVLRRVIIYGSIVCDVMTITFFVEEYCGGVFSLVWDCVCDPEKVEEKARERRVSVLRYGLGRIFSISFGMLSSPGVFSFLPWPSAFTSSSKVIGSSVRSGV